MKKKDKTHNRQQSKNNKKNQRDIRSKHKKERYKDAFKLSPTYVNFYREFDKEIKTTGLELRDVGGDGNCLFRSISDQIEGQEGMYDIYRKMACRHIKQNQQFYTMYLDEDDEGTLDDYLKQMVIDGQWGGNMEIYALSECLNMNIVIHRKSLYETIVTPYHQNKSINKKRFTIHLAYFQEQEFQHYTSVRVIGDQSQNPSIQSLSKLQKYKHLDIVKQKKNKWDDSSDDESSKIHTQNDGERIVGIESEQQQQPYPNYPRNKKCKCGNNQPYKNCCYKEFQKRKAKKK